MSLVAIARRLPTDFQLPMLEFAEAIEEDLRAQLAVRREDFEALQAVVKELAEAQRRTEQRVAELAEAQRRTEQRLEELVFTVNRLAMRVEAMAPRLDGLIGDNLERRYRERPYAYFGHVLRKAQAVPWTDIEELLEERLSEPEVADLRVLDLLVRGRPREAGIGDELWLAVEVSKVVDRIDVERALRRAAMLRKAGFLAVPVAAGEGHTLGSDEAARETGVALVEDGTLHFWEEALGRIRPAA